MLDREANILPSIGVVVIGRNEGDRLRGCLTSGVCEAPFVVYVDSGSTDGSVKLARSLAVDTIELDPSTPFSAARARNEGYRRLLQQHPSLSYLQFVDGDCELCAGWLCRAGQFLRNREDVAAVSGRLREKNAGNSIYNTLCDIEWDIPSGATSYCGGIAMMRVSALDRVQGFRIDLIAGEEPELCVRLRKQGWMIWRLDSDMALHDAAMLRFNQWWTRAQRSGHAFAQGAALHGAPPENHGVKESRSNLFWGLGVPLVAIGLAAFFGPPGLLILAIYPVQVMRLALRGARTTRENWLYALFLVIGKFPGLQGLLQFRIHRIFGRSTELMEYK